MLAPLSANRDECHEAWFRQRVAPAMPGAVLHDAITLTQMNLLSVVQFQRHLATNDDPIVDSVRGMHSWRTAFEMLAHARNLLRQLLQSAVEGNSRRRLPAVWALGRL